MAENVVFIPISRKLYDDIVRFSDGKADPAELAEWNLEAWITRDLEIGDGSLWGERFNDVAAEYAPHVLSDKDRLMVERDREATDLAKPLVWKEVSIPAGSEVRMSYRDTHHYAKVEAGRISDVDGTYTPSEWASKIADGTSRNAWRDLWFRERHSKTWVPATLLRQKARAQIDARTASSTRFKPVAGDTE